MSTVIAGLFDTGPRAAAALGQLRMAGVDDPDVCEFAINPPGQHGSYAIGGDRDESPGAEHIDEGGAKGAMMGGAVGLVVGAAAALAVGPFAIPLAAGAGAYSGSLVGGLNETGDGPPRTERLRPAGTLVAVNVSASDKDELAIARILKSAGAVEVERAEGQWTNGAWADFDPLQPPNRIDQ
ncbi:hypothetical protein BWI17_04085 [Betaproteobacteria bacterium GR16-43]|nr:hypothetical protein BWI17_04085 [Betaproteobacteria bacterium GR16-43]